MTKLHFSKTLLFFMPMTTCATAASTSAMPPPSSTPANPETTATHPVSLPQHQSLTAHRFDPQNPSALTTYLSDYESLAEATQLTLGECLALSTCYMAEEEKDDWVNLPEFEA